VNITEVTTIAGWIAGLAIVALVATGWRKRARPTADPARARRPLRAPIGVEVEELPSRGYLPPRWYQRVWSVLAMSGLAIWVGAVVATLIGFGTATLVIRVTEMLKK